jgi:hypothetical protein
MSQDTEQFTRQTDERHVVVGTKLSRASAEQLARIAKHKGCTIYQLIQMVCDTLIRYTDDRHNLTQEMEQAMTIFEHMTGWADSINIVDPTIQKEIVSAVYILQDAEGKKKGLRATMVDKPWMGIWNQTENVLQIFERLFNILMPELYTKLYRARVELECNTVCEVINLLADAEVIARLNDEYRKDFEDCARADNGKDYGYGRRTKGHQHRTPDSLAMDQRLKFDDYDRQCSDQEAAFSEFNHQTGEDDDT